MSFNATLFINNRLNKTSITDNRIKSILHYIVDCYDKIIDDKIVYDYSKRGKVSQENFLRNGLVDDYLRKNLHLLNKGTDEYSIVNKEATETYLNVNDNLDHDDPIDIHIVDNGLQTSWGSNSQVYYAIECKRIKSLSDTTSYVDDIRKFSERNYKEARLPFEGQLAFIENKSLTNTVVKDDINSKLKTHATVITDKYLSDIKIHHVNCTYDSVHKKKFGANEPFSIYHLFFDYSKIVID
ncbi:hypothetical protein [Mariniflexile sp. HMF6888]|uniref:hypothetical protein n=1 Tax=Mariniflexile sp. HMF6888 TaxID=3373086 RepID=UPI00378FBFA6